MAGGAILWLPEAGLNERTTAFRMALARTGKLSARPAGEPVDSFTAGRVCETAWSAVGPRLQSVYQAWRNLSSDVLTTPEGHGFDSRKSAPGPGKRPRRELRALLIVRMSSDRLFLDRVGRHQRPSPLHRHEKLTIASPCSTAKHDISTLPATRHFYFALTVVLFSGDRLSDI